MYNIYVIYISTCNYWLFGPTGDRVVDLLNLLENRYQFINPEGTEYIIFQCFWRYDRYNSNIYFPFSSGFGLYQPLREIYGWWTAKCSTMFTSYPLTLSACHLVLSYSWIKLYRGSRKTLKLQLLKQSNELKHTGKLFRTKSNRQAEWQFSVGLL